MVREAPSGGAVELQLRQGSTAYCTLTIADGATISNPVNGFGLPPLVAGAQLNLDITVGADGGGYAAGARSDGDDPALGWQNANSEADVRIGICSVSSFSRRRLRR